MRNKHIRFCAFLLAFALVLTMGAVAANISDFKDVPEDAWYYDYLAYASETGLINGTSSTTFSPLDNLTRAQFATIFGRAFGYEVNPGTKFTDVKNDSWYAGYVYWAVENGIVNGTSSTTFSPEANITRQDVATILGRYIDAFNIFLISSESALSAFVDADKISGYAVSHCNLLREVGILNGDKAGCMNPGKDMSRAEGMTVLVRLIWAIEEVEQNGAGNLGGDAGDPSDPGNTGDGSGDEGNSGNEGDGGETGCKHLYAKPGLAIQYPSEENGFVGISATYCGNCEKIYDYVTEQTYFSNEWSYDGGYHYHEPISGIFYVVKDKGEHEYPAIATLIEAPSATNGYKAVYGRYCKVCGYLERGY